jgi:citrate lyase subunit beta/citryl-CoA lyase
MTAQPAVGVLPRSFLYVPATKPDLFDKAAAGPADAIVLDLEDAVPLSEKDAARERVRAWLREGATAAGRTQQTWVRVNADSIEADLEAVVGQTLSGIFLAKCRVEVLAEATEALGRLESARRLDEQVRVVGLVESAGAVLELPEMARAPRLTTLGIGEADLLADLRVTRSPATTATVDALRAQVVLHCAAAGRQPPVAPTSTDFRDLDRFAETTRDLHDVGFRSRTAVHPGQVPVINEVFSPSADAIAAARDVVDRFETAGSGVTVDAAGRLIDAAVVRTARETLERAQR